MNNFEQIDDYLSGKLDAAGKAAFEQSLEADSQLKAEATFQQQLIGGIQKARVTELKAMLNQVPLPPVGGTAAVTAGKIIAVAVTVGIVGAALYYGLKEDATEPAPVRQEQMIPPAEQPNPDAEAIADDQNDAEEDVTVKSKAPTVEKESNPATEDRPKEVQPVRPKIEAADPTQEMIVENAEPDSFNRFPRESVTVSSIEVETHPGDRQHNFHYQFHTGKLLLYGPFDDKLYEIIEINGETQSTFLYYDESYYLLDEKKTNLTPLTPITDKILIEMLNDYRNS